MENRKDVTGTVVNVKRTGRYTIYGNPIMHIELQVIAHSGQTWRETFRISDNSSLTYAIENRTFSTTPHAFELTRAGRISGNLTGDCECGD